MVDLDQRSMLFVVWGKLFNQGPQSGLSAESNACTAPADCIIKKHTPNDLFALLLTVDIINASLPHEL